MAADRRVRSDLWLLVAVVVGLAAIVQLNGVQESMRSAVTTPYVDDFERDLYGASAVMRGESPYQRLGEIEATFRGRDEATHWVGHSPLAIAGALGALSIWNDIEGLASIARAAGLGFVIIAILSALFLRRWSVLFAVLAIVGTSSFTAAMRWNQHSVVVAALVVLILRLEKSPRDRGLALLILGLLVAFKPWLMPLAFCLPSSRSSWRDVLQVGLVAGAATLLASLVLGGIGILRDWLLVALPNNMEEYSTVAGNRSLTARLGSEVATLMFLVGAASLAVLRGHVDRSLWPLLGWTITMTLSPLVWDVYLVDISVMLLYGILVSPRQFRVEPLLVMGSTIIATFLYFRFPMPIVSFFGVVGGQLMAGALVGLHLVRRYRANDIPMSVDTDHLSNTRSPTG